MGSVERKVAGRGRGSVRAGPGPNWGEATNCSPPHNATTAWRPIAGVEVPLGGEMVLGGERRAEKTLQLGSRVFAEVVKSIRTRSRITRISRKSLFSGTLRDGFSSWRFFFSWKWQRVRRAISSTLFFSALLAPKDKIDKHRTWVLSQ